VHRGPGLPGARRTIGCRAVGRLVLPARVLRYSPDMEFWDSVMLSGVGIICFAGSYAVTLALEISRLLFRSGVRGAVMLGFAGAGLVAHTAFLYYRAVNTAGPPLSSSQDWYLVAAWVLVVVYLYLVYYHPKTAFGLFLLPLVLGLIGTAKWVASPQPFAREPASQVWGAIHGVSLALAVAALLVGEWLQQANSRAMIVAVVMLGVGVASGTILNLIRRAEPSERLPWHDPFVLATLVTFGWLVLAVVAGKLYRPALHGRKVAYLTLVSFLMLVLTLCAGLLLNTQHGGGRPDHPDPVQSRVVCPIQGPLGVGLCFPEGGP